MKIAFTTPEFITERNFDGGLSNYLNGVTSFLAAEYGSDVHVFTLSERSETIRHNDVTVHRVKRLGKPLGYRLLDKLMRPVFGHKMVSFLRARQDSRRIAAAVEWESAQAPFTIVQAASYLHTGYDLARNRHRGYPVVTRFSSSQQLINAGYGRAYNPVTAVHTCFEALQGYYSDGRFCPSYVLRDHLLPLVGKPIRVIESPANISLVSPDDSFYQQHLAGKPYLLFYGTLGRLKGIEVVARMLFELLEAHPELHLVCIGKDVGVGGGQSAEALLKARAGLHAARVRCFPPMSRARLFPVVSNSLAVVLPSLVDNMPNTAIESMALGAVVVGTRGASFEQLITDSRDGFLVECGDAAALRTAVDKAVALSPAQRVRMGTAAKKTIERLMPRKTIPALFDYYELIVDEYQQRPGVAGAKETR